MTEAQSRVDSRTEAAGNPVATAAGGRTAEQVVTAATGNVAATYGLDAGSLKVGAPADLLVLDAPIGSTARDAFEALRIGDIPAVACVVTEGELRVSRSRNTPPPNRGVTCRTR